MLAMAFALLHFLSSNDRRHEDLSLNGTAAEGIAPVEARESGVSAVEPASGPAEGSENEPVGTLPESPVAGTGEVAEPSDGHVPVTERIPESEWQQIRERSGLAIQPRREFFSNPVPVRVAHSSLQAARNRTVSQLTFDLGMEKLVAAEVGKVFEHSPDAYTLVGKIDGDPLSDFSVSVYEDAVVGTFQSAETGILQLRFVGEGVHRWNRLMIRRLLNVRCQ